MGGIERDRPLGCKVLRRSTSRQSRRAARGMSDGDRFEVSAFSVAAFAVALQTAAFVGSLPAIKAASTVRLPIPESRFSASLIWRASWISFRERPTSAAVGALFSFETLLTRSPPAVCTSPRACAASYSSARRRFTCASMSSASACARKAALRLNGPLARRR